MANRSLIRWAIIGWAAAIIALSLIGSARAQRFYLERGLSPALPEPIPHAGVRLGVNVQLEQYDDAQLEETLTAIAATPSIRWLKQSFNFSDSAESNWIVSDRIVNAVARFPSLKLVPLLDGDPSDDYAPPPPQQFANWSAEFATRYGQVIDYYIIWDEPNLSSHWGGKKVNPDDYAALLTTANQAIKSADATAIIIAAPLAPTTESDSVNLADPLYLQAMYEAEAQFDVVAGKPYGFDDSAEDRTVALEHLNFSRAILLREVMERNGDSGTALWAGNWGWNSLSADWQGEKSIWGEVSAEQQLEWTASGLLRAQREWHWMGVMFLENWQPFAQPLDPIWGFGIADSAVSQIKLPDEVAYPGFHLAEAQGVGQNYTGDWRFSAVGADSSEKYVEQGQIRDTMTFRFWGTEVGMRVRRADFRARYYVTVDGKPANARPSDENGTVVVLDAPNPNEDYITIEKVADGLTPDFHTLEITAHRGWGQWALNGLSVGYRPNLFLSRLEPLLWGVSVLGMVLGCYAGWRSAWGNSWRKWGERFGRWSDQRQLAVFSLIATVLATSGALTFYNNGGSFYRRLGDVPQLALTTLAASIFYVTPTFYFYLIALIFFCLIVSWRPAWGIAAITLVMPFYARPELLKPIFTVYRFSLTEIFTLAVCGSVFLAWALANHATKPRRFRWDSADSLVVAFVITATISAQLAAQQNAAMNEWRWVIVEPALYYFLWRVVPLSRREVAVILGAWVVSGLIIALYGWAQLLFGVDDLITAELGLRRLQSIYGSPNNVALYLGRLLPLLICLCVMNKGWLRIVSGLIGAIIGITLLLTFSKGALVFGVPIALLILLSYGLRERGYNVGLWVGSAVLAGIIAFILLLQLPQLAGRLNLTGSTSFVRVYLWRSSLEMIREHPWWGIGLDNFLYAYRGRYVLESAWREPNLNHPHNFFFDFATRLGLIGLAVGIGLFGRLAQLLGQIYGRRAQLSRQWQAVALGIAGGFGQAIAHGMVDHSYFIIDLAFLFFMMLGLVQWFVQQNVTINEDSDTSAGHFSAES